jgi:hypothetical protein
MRWVETLTDTPVDVSARHPVCIYLQRTLRDFFLGAGLSTVERAAPAAAVEQRCRPLCSVSDVRESESRTSAFPMFVKVNHEHRRFRCSWKWITNISVSDVRESESRTSAFPMFVKVNHEHRQVHPAPALAVLSVSFRRSARARSSLVTRVLMSYYNGHWAASRYGCLYPEWKLEVLGCRSVFCISCARYPSK